VKKEEESERERGGEREREREREGEVGAACEEMKEQMGWID
jgi:hypothetical protein